MRIVSLLPAATEIVAALGALDRLVGVTHECDYPAALLGSRARVTSSAVDAGATAGALDAQVRALAGQGASLFTLDERTIAALRPDVVVTQALCDVCAVSETDVRALAARLTPTPAVVTLSGTTLDGVFADIERVAAALDLRDEGEELLDGLRARVRRVHETLKAAHAPRPRVAVIEWTDPVYAAGHWVPEMVRRAGGVDVLARAGEHSVERAVSDVAAGDPEVLVFAPCGYDATRAAVEARRTLALPEWRWAAGRPAWAIDANGLVSRPGPRLVDGIEVLAGVMHPELFGTPSGERAIQI
ncbi:MAG TPA: ABC transporter substrate-binding protein [Gemmatimonadaceae bacterium]|nr:ABC transporter substrate-binding protein [Gemmatimonadaceae bacterium]